MQSLKDRVYQPDCSHNDMDLDAYYARGDVFGRFIENGRGYVIERRDTPREWAQYLCNDKVRCAVSNNGKGFIFHANGVRVAKHMEVNGNYLPRNLNGERKLMIESDGEMNDFFTQSENYTCTVRPGYVVFEGDVQPFHIKVCIFVPQTAPCECWNVQIVNNGTSAKTVKVQAKQDVFLADVPEIDKEHNNIRVKVKNSWAPETATSVFGANQTQDIRYEPYTETYMNGDNVEYYRETLETTLQIAPNEAAAWNIVSGACTQDGEAEQVLRYVNGNLCAQELCDIIKMWNGLLDKNTCSVPDKNLENFLNVWLKNQLYLTYRYDRSTRMTGYRDGMQDSWGYLLIDPVAAKKKIMFLLSCMHPDGRCPRGIHKYGEMHDLDDFCDAPIWIPIALNAYIKETGDYGILEEQVGFFKSDEMSTVENHVYRSLDYMYHSRGKNGLILMRDGDWADGLSGINKYGADATSAWVTIAAYNAQNLMAEIYRKIGQDDKAAEMEKRSAEYKKIVNDAAWDGKWLVYAFFEDGEPIGSAQNLEGKIWLNPQTWGIFTGIVDDTSRIKKMSDAVSRYLDTPYGAMINYPPYVLYGERCGRIQRQHPGMFLNSSVYNHAATFKIFSDVKRGEYDLAYDTYMRCLPNHADNPDTRRTGEPFAVGNVYYGIDHPRAGMNLFTWFTAAPAWLMHGGFEEILGVKADFDGIRITPHVPEDWNEYSVSKLYRGTEYHIRFVRSDNKKILADGKEITGNLVYSEKSACNVEVYF